MIPRRGVHSERAGEAIAPSSERARKRKEGPRDPRDGFAGAFTKGPAPKTIMNPPRITPQSKSGSLFHK